MAKERTTPPSPEEDAEENVFSHRSSEEQHFLNDFVFQRRNPRLYLRHYLDDGVRPDGRAFLGWRDTTCNIGLIFTADGSTLLQMGETTILCRVKAEIAVPELERPGEGFLVPNLELPLTCWPRFKTGPPTEEAKALSKRLSEVLISSKYLPLSTLCIQRGKSAWIIYVDATCMKHDGNVFDATWLSMVVALKHTKLPEASYDAELDRTICSWRAPRVALQLGQSIPVAMSFGFFNSNYLLADPTSFEETLLDASITIVLGDDRDLVSMEPLKLTRAGEAEQDTAFDVDPEVFEECMQNAGQRREFIIDEIFG